MTTLNRASLIALPVRRELLANATACGHPTWAGPIALARRRRERILGCVALVMLIVAWDASLRLDERVSPPRMRTSHAVEIDSDQQAMTAMEK